MNCLKNLFIFKRIKKNWKTLNTKAQKTDTFELVWLCGDLPTAESSSKVCILQCTTRSQNRKFHWFLVAFKGTIRRNLFRGKHNYHERKELEKKKFYLLSLKCWFRGVVHRAESNFSNFVIEYLGKKRLNSKILYPVYQGKVTHSL